MRLRTNSNHKKSHALFFPILLVTFSSRCCANKTLSPKIIGGFRAMRGEFPAFAAIFRIKLNELMFQCGGCYIRQFWVVTAAHCIYNMTTRKAYAPEKIYIKMGMLQLTEHSQQRPAEKLIVHEKYKPYPRNKFRDIGLVKLMLPFDIVPLRVSIATLNTKREISRDVAVVGFGLMHEKDTKPSNELRVVNLMVWKKKDDLIIIMDRTPKGTCYGDSGGPLYVRRNKLVIGLVSAGVCARGIGYYTNVRSYRKWLRKNMSEDGSNVEAKMITYASSFLLLLLYDYLLFIFNNK